MFSISKQLNVITLGMNCVMSGTMSALEGAMKSVGLGAKVSVTLRLWGLLGKLFL